MQTFGFGWNFSWKWTNMTEWVNWTFHPQWRQQVLRDETLRTEGEGLQCFLTRARLDRTRTRTRFWPGRFQETSAIPGNLSNLSMYSGNDFQAQMTFEAHAHWACDQQNPSTLHWLELLLLRVSGLNHEFPVKNDLFSLNKNVYVSNLDTWWSRLWIPEYLVLTVF